MVFSRRYLNIRTGSSAVRPLSGQYLSFSSLYTKLKSIRPFILRRRWSFGMSISYNTEWSLNCIVPWFGNITLWFTKVKLQKIEEISKLMNISSIILSDPYEDFFSALEKSEAFFVIGIYRRTSLSHAPVARFRGSSAKPRVFTSPAQSSVSKHRFQ